MGRKAGFRHTEEFKNLLKKKFKGKNNPFHGKKHTAQTKKMMSKNHANFKGDNNPFKKSLQNPKNRIAHKNRCKKIWANRDEQTRKNIATKLQKGYEEINGSFWSRIKSNAKQRNRTVDVTIEYCWKLFIKQNRICALSGIPIKFSTKSTECTASLDRIDNNKSYVEGNIQWVHKVVNLMKRTLSEKEFLSYCKIITNYQLQSCISHDSLNIG